MNQIPEALSVYDAAAILGISEQRTRTLLRQGSIEGKQVGKTWITSEKAINNFKGLGNGQTKGKTKGPEDRPRNSQEVPELKALSFFSGAMGLDQGLERVGIHSMLACEFDKASRQTIVANKPDIGLIGDIWNYTAQEILNFAGLDDKEDVDVMVGGPPCQSFSTAGARRGFQDDRGNALLRFVNLILEIRPKYAVIENVRGLLSAPMVHTPHSLRGEDWIPTREEMPGGALFHVLQLLRAAGYGISFNLYNAMNFGVPQSRERVVILCSRDGAVLPHLSPTHSLDESFGLPRVRTLRDALAGLDPKYGNWVEFPEKRLKYYRILKAGQYWKHLPIELHREALGGSLDSGGGKTGFLRRLSWEKPSCTLVTSPIMPATDICHPEELRPLSVEEYKRIQQFSDDWVVCGSITDQYKQIGNAVPVGLGEAVGLTILDHMKGIQSAQLQNFPYSRYRNTDEINWEKQLNSLLISTRVKSSKQKTSGLQQDLFAS
jgi:DNA (cytosine-5)-methyltransferase 1